MYELSDFFRANVRKNAFTRDILPFAKCKFHPFPPESKKGISESIEETLPSPKQTDLGAKLPTIKHYVAYS